MQQAKAKKTRTMDRKNEAGRASDLPSTGFQEGFCSISKRRRARKNLKMREKGGGPACTR
jgi:hypothetical protein